MKLRKQYGKVDDGKVEIFVAKQNTQVEDKAPGYYPFFGTGLPGLIRLRMLGFFQQNTAQVSDCSGKKDQYGILRVPAHIKIVAGGEQPEVFDPVRYDIVDDQNYGKEYQKFERIKKQSFVLLSGSFTYLLKILTEMFQLILFYKKEPECQAFTGKKMIDLSGVFIYNVCVVIRRCTQVAEGSALEMR